MCSFWKPKRFIYSRDFNYLLNSFTTQQMSLQYKIEVLIYKKNNVSSIITVVGWGGGGTRNGIKHVCHIGIYRTTTIDPSPIVTFFFSKIVALIRATNRFWTVEKRKIRIIYSNRPSINTCRVNGVWRVFCFRTYTVWVFVNRSH